MLISVRTCAPSLLHCSIVRRLRSAECRSSGVRVPLRILLESKAPCIICSHLFSTLQAGKCSRQLDIHEVAVEPTNKEHNHDNKNYRLVTLNLRCRPWTICDFDHSPIFFGQYENISPVGPCFQRMHVRKDPGAPAREIAR